MTQFTCSTSSPPLSPNSLITFRNNQTQQPNTSTWLCPPIQTTFTSTTPPSPQLPPSSPPSSPPLSLPPLDLTPPNQDTSEFDNSNNFLKPDYNDTNDGFGIPLEWPPSRPMVIYPNDRELGKRITKLVGNSLKKIQDFYLPLTLVSINVFWIHPKINLKTSSMLCLTTICTQSWLKKLTNMHKERKKLKKCLLFPHLKWNVKLSFFHKILFFPKINYVNRPFSLDNLFRTIYLCPVHFFVLHCLWRSIPFSKPSLHLPDNPSS